MLLSPSDAYSARSCQCLAKTLSMSLSVILARKLPQSRSASSRSSFLANSHATCSAPSYSYSGVKVASCAASVLGVSLIVFVSHHFSTSLHASWNLSELVISKVCTLRLEPTHRKARCVCVSSARLLKNLLHDRADRAWLPWYVGRDFDRDFLASTSKPALRVCWIERERVRVAV